MVDPWSYAEKTRNEYAEQVALFMWANMAAQYGHEIAMTPAAYTVAGWAKHHGQAAIDSGNSYPLPQLNRLFAIKNAGHGDAIRGAMSKAEGVKPGVPDIMLPVPKLAPCFAPAIGVAVLHNGYFLELKRRKSARGGQGRASSEQTDWHKYLVDTGYKVDIFVGWELARDGLLRYLDVIPTE